MTCTETIVTKEAAKVFETFNEHNIWVPEQTAPCGGHENQKKNVTRIFGWNQEVVRLLI